jgi:hypothetical protein
MEQPGAQCFIPWSDGVLYVPSEMQHIQEAINAAWFGQTVQVAAGTYVENINFNGKNISVIGADSNHYH